MLLCVNNQKNNNLFLWMLPNIEWRSCTGCKIIMKIKTRKPKSYPGDRTVQVIAVREDNSWIGLMNLTKTSCDGYVFYKNDTVSNKFRTITEAKQWCEKNINTLAPGWKQ